MKKIYFTLSALLILNLSQAQTLTKAANEPVIGDSQTTKGYDSVGVVPKAIGAGVSWNFSAFTPNTNTASSVFTSTVGAMNATLFPGATLVEDQGGGNLNYWKSVPTPSTQYEQLGSVGGGSNFSYTNSAIYAVWPVSFGYNNTDTYDGPISGTFSGSLNGTVTTSASGTGTLTIPGGLQFTNVLQLKAVNNVSINITSPAQITTTIGGIDYNYFHSSQKFPLLTVSYQFQQGQPNSINITVNNAVITGLNEKNFDATFQIFPNPAKDAFKVNLSNSSNETGIIEIYNNVGQLTKTINLGNASSIEQNVSLQDLSSGIYIVKTMLGNRVSSRKLIIE